MADSVVKYLYRPLLLLGAVVLVWYGFRYLYFRPSVHAGDRSPLFTAILAGGQAFDLEDFRGKYVLLDFWGSWCGPCIRSYPELQLLYGQYHDTAFTSASGFEVVSVAIERDSSHWIRALEVLRPQNPYQILDKSTSFRFFNGPIAKRYGVRQLPAKFLIGPDGALIGTHWSLEDVRTYLNAQLQRPEG